MAKPTAVLVPQETVNDQSVTILSWLVSDGQVVAKGQPVVEVEGSKTSFEVCAPEAGVFRFTLPQGAEVPVGSALGHVESAEEPEPPRNGETPTPPAPDFGVGAPPGGRGVPGAWTPAAGGPPPANLDVGAPSPTLAGDAQRLGVPHGQGTGAPAPPAESAAPPSGQEPAPPPGGRGGTEPGGAPPAGTGVAGARFSKEALRLIHQHGVDLQAFAGRGLVKAQDVLALVGRAQAPPASEPPGRGKPTSETIPEGPVAARGVPFRTEALPRAKRTEISYLRSASRHALPSVVSVPVPTRGLRAAAGRDPHLKGNATALVLYEAARLLWKYPAFNGFYDGSAHYYEEVNIGFAVDAGHGLKVPVVRRADQKGIPEIARQMQEALVRYLDDSLPVEALAGGTFTVTDLSGEGVLEFVPLLNQGQSAILGVGGEWFFPDSPHGLYTLILGFDHQLAGGRQAAQFLNELRQRLVHYEAALRRGAAGGRGVPGAWTPPAGGPPPANLDGEAPPPASPGSSMDAAVGRADRDTEPRCSECFRPVSELNELRGHLVAKVNADGSQDFICSGCLAGF